jgi:regulator of protease activity HflC (stomatin/prohibitin superfamily)
MFRFIQSASTGVRQTFGRFTGLDSPGLAIYIPFIQSISVVSNRLQQDNFHFETKTSDNVFVNLGISVQYLIKPEDSEKAFFSLDDPLEQINSYIENVVRSQVPKMTLDKLFESQDDICNNVGSQLSDKMAQNGYTIKNTLITNIDPDEIVKKSMNQINASYRLKEAAKNEAEANYIKCVKEAEADSERKRLQGEGIRLQREAIIKGYKQGVHDMMASTGLTSKDIVDFMRAMQELDTMESIGRSNNAKTLFFDRVRTSDTDANVIRANEVK